MKKVVISLLLLLCAASSFAAGRNALSAYTPLYIRNLGMGGASVASSRFEEVIYSNPALIGYENQYFSTPSVNFSLYNFNKLIQPGGALDIFLTQGQGDEVVNRALNQLINSIGSGESDVISAQFSTGFISGITGLSFDGGVDIHSFGSGGESSTLVMEANFAVSLALALPITFAENHTIRFGAGAHLVFRGFTINDMLAKVISPGGFTAGSLTDFYLNDDTLITILNEANVAFGFAVPIDLGFAYKYRDTFTFGLALKNLNGRYFMQTYNGVNQLYYSLTGSYFGDSEPTSSLVEGTTYTFNTNFTLDAGFMLSTPDEGLWRWLDVTFAFDFVDIWSLFFEDSFDSASIVSRIKTGLELRVMNTFDFRIGLNSGYLSFGFGFDFQIFTVDFLYATLEYGDRIGDNPVDFISITFRLGLES